MICITILAQKEIHIIQTGDIHGWIYGHKDKPYLGDLGTLLSYYENVIKNISNNKDASVVLVDSGDQCEGTGLSDAISPRCSQIYNFLSKLPYNAMILGNHDLSSGDGMQYLHDNLKMFPTQPFVTTNVFYKDKQYFSQPFKFERLSNGQNILHLGFMYPSKNQYENTFVTDANESLYYPEIQKAFADHIAETDLLLLNFHQGTGMPLVNHIYKEVRHILKTKFNSLVPIHVLCGHVHLKWHLQCPYFPNGILKGRDPNCFNTEAGSFLRDIQHTVWTISGGGNDYVTQIQYFKDSTFDQINLATRFNIPQNQFMTYNGKELSKQLKEKIHELKLDEVIGVSKFKYEKQAAQKHPQSMLRLMLDAMSPSLVYQKQKECTQFAVIRSALARVDLKKGEFTFDDAVISVPYQYDMQMIPGMSGEEAKCVIQYANLWVWAVNDNEADYGKETADLIPNYVHPHTNWTDKCYDLISNTYEVPRLFMSFPYCNITRKVDAQMYNSISGINRTDLLFQQYLKDNFQILNKEQIKREGISFQWWALGIQVVAIIIVVLALQQRASKSLLYDNISE